MRPWSPTLDAPSSPSFGGALVYLDFRRIWDPAEMAQPPSPTSQRRVSQHTVSRRVNEAKRGLLSSARKWAVRMRTMPTKTLAECMCVCAISAALNQMRAIACQEHSAVQIASLGFGWPARPVDQPRPGWPTVARPTHPPCLPYHQSPSCTIMPCQCHAMMSGETREHNAAFGARSFRRPVLGSRGGVGSRTVAPRATLLASGDTMSRALLSPPWLTHTNWGIPEFPCVRKEAHCKVWVWTICPIPCGGGRRLQARV